MRYEDRELQILLARDYVAGLITGAARKRFEALLLQYPSLATETVKWQEDLRPLSDAIEPIQPPAHVFEKIRHRVQRGSKSTRDGWWQRLATWRSMAFINGAVALSLGAILSVNLMVTPPSPDNTLKYVGALAGQDQQDRIAVLAYAKPWRLTLNGTELPTIPNGSELRIWYRVGSAGAFQYLAATTSPDQAIPLSKEVWRAMKGATDLAISLSPKERPTDSRPAKFLYQGHCVKLEDNLKRSDG